MSSNVKSIVHSGMEGQIVDIECHMSNGLPSMIIVGSAGKSVDESRERIRSSFANSELALPRKRITINLAPADFPKSDSSLDLPIAAAILLCSGQAPAHENQQTAVIGELGLDGSVKPVRGIIGKLMSGKKSGINRYYIPSGNMHQALLVPGVSLFPVSHLKDLYLDWCGIIKITAGQIVPVKAKTDGPKQDFYDFSSISGQHGAKRAIEIAAAGGHNILLNGPPGTGKSLLAKAVPGILPDLNDEEIVEVTHIHSLANSLNQVITNPPFRSPHHSASEAAIVGGGQNAKPGEISLSHRGVLFMDEFPEYKRSTIEALRQPLEDGVITVSRAKDTQMYPARFMLVATSNPCPCGYYGTHKECSCQPFQIQQYQRKISGPILDRIDLYVDVEPIEHSALLNTSQEEKSEKVKSRVQNARKIQAIRHKDSLLLNSSLTNKHINELLRFGPGTKELLDNAAKRLGLSARTYIKTIKVAQTIADLESAEEIYTRHISEALQYRRHEISA